MADEKVRAQGVAMAEYRPGSWDGLGAPVDYPEVGLGYMGGEENLTANETAAQKAIAEYAQSGRRAVFQDVHTGEITTFSTGATRSTETPFDPEGFISPAVLVSFSDYMTKHRTQADGKLRASDNWQKGMPTSRAYRSLTRHFMDLWLIRRGYKPRSADCQSDADALCAILFNTMLILKNKIDGNDHEEQK